MSYSLMIANGDLSFNGASLDTVDGSDKLVQDLTCCILEPMGTDQMYPSFGSLIDGGIDTNGDVISGVIGTPNDSVAAALVNGEVQRICDAYQSQQQARYSADVQTYGKPTITASEALLSVDGVVATQTTDVMSINATLSTGVGNLSVTLPVSTSN
jgi:hypothetical protein